MDFVAVFATYCKTQWEQILKKNKTKKSSLSSTKSSISFLKLKKKNGVDFKMLIQEQYSI